MSEDSEDDKPKRTYEVGYGRPPKDTQFKQGHCPNLKGRPKGSKNFSTELHEALNERVIINVNGQRKKISKRKAAAMQLANKAAAGDPKTVPILMQHDIRVQQAQVAAEASQPEAASEADRMVMESLIKRIREAEAFSASSEIEPEDRTPSSNNSKGD